MARAKLKPVEPEDLPPLEHEAISIFIDAGWREDAQWLGPLALSVFKEADGERSESLLGPCATNNIKVVARSWSDANVLADRNRALLMAFVRLCGCGGKSAPLWSTMPSLTDPQHPPKAAAGLAAWRQIAKQFRQDRPHAKGADFERVLVQSGWPGDYGTEHELYGTLTLHAHEMADSHRTRPFGEWQEIVRLMHLLVDAAELDLARVIDDGAVVAAGVPRWGPDPQEPVQLRIPTPPDLKPDSASNPRLLSNWMAGIGPRALRLFFAKFADWKNERYAGVMALGVRDAIEKWLRLSGHHPTHFREGGQPLAEATRPYFDLLDTHSAHAAVEGPTPLRRAWLWFALCTFEADPNSWTSLDSKARETLLRAANEDISRLRKLLSRAQPRPLKDDERDQKQRELARWGEAPLPPLTAADLCQGWGHLLPADAEGPIEEKQRAPWEEFEWEKDHLQTCLLLLYQFGGVWRGLKPMLLAWRALATQGVARDLGYWQEPDRETPPYPWADLFAWPINLFHVFVGKEQAKDPGLVELRGELASFCLERLVDRWSQGVRDEARRSGRARTNDDMLERSPEWRYCLIRAAGALGLNPEGKGHRILRMAADLDPDEDVREAANQGYEQLRRNVELPEGVSPRRAVMSALWWIRQAHLLGLGIQPDPDGAQRTRVKELARTKETERAR